MTKTRPAALVTGANRGIGRGIAVALAHAGFDVVVNDIASTADTDETLRLVRAAGAQATFVAADISDAAARPGLVDPAFAAFGRLHCLVNNAGVQVKVRGDLLDVTEESFDRLHRVNLRGTFFLTQAVAKRMLATPADEHARTIVTISSANAFIVGINRGEYCLAKSALSMMTKLFAVRLADEGIRCYEIRPGIIRTDMTRPVADRYDKMIAEGIAPIRRWGEPEDVGRTVAMLASGGLPFSTGDEIHVDGGMHVQRL
jgi:3-oxoacyl-[acyl-carrier protein] reductase